MSLALMMGILCLLALPAARKWPRLAITHAALIVGSIFFCIPFMWQISTSLKEDKDVALTTGFKLIPEVQDTVKFFDEKKPIYEGVLDGTVVRGERVRTQSDGQYVIDVHDPAAMRAMTLIAPPSQLKTVAKDGPVVRGTYQGREVQGYVEEEMQTGDRAVRLQSPSDVRGALWVAHPNELTDVRHIGARWQNYKDALEYLPPETHMGLVYLGNSVLLVLLNVLGTLFSSSLVAYAFSRLRFPWRDKLFKVMLSTMMLPAAVTLLPTFLLYRSLGWVDTLQPLWFASLFGSALNVFLFRQFFLGLPMELEDAAKVDGCNPWRTYWNVMLPQIRPAMAVVAITTFIATWSNFQGPMIYISSPEHMTVAYAVQLFMGDRSGEPALLMAFSFMAMIPVLAVFLFAQKYFLESMALTGLGGR